MFPENFVWGVASSAYQIEGYSTADGGGKCVWDTFGEQAGSIFGGDSGAIACDAYHRYAEDIALMAELGIKSYRFSISWARVDPKADGSWNAAGLAYYDKLVDCCLAHGIEPYMTLHHWELPQAAEDKGGWQVRETAQAFSRFALMTARHFSGRLRHFITLNEPQCVIQLGYGLGVHAPGKKLDIEGQFRCWKNMMLAHGMAYTAIKAFDSSLEVGFASTGRLCYPEKDTAEDMKASYDASFELFDEDWVFTHSMALDAICHGRFPANEGTRLFELAGTISDEEWGLIHVGADFLGINIYNGWAVRRGENGKGEYVSRAAGFPRTALKWPVTERVMNEGIVHIYKRYGLPIYISENGLSCNDKIYLDGAVHDADRIDFLIRYLRQLSLAAEHVELRGYFHWSFTDNLEWHNGYAERFGLVFVDYETQRRIPKDSAYWYKTIIQSLGERI